MGFHGKSSHTAFGCSQLTSHSYVFGHKRAAFACNVTLRYTDGPRPHARIPNLAVPPTHLPNLFNIPTTPSIGDLALRHCARQPNIPHWEATKRRLLRQFGCQAPGIILCCDIFPFHTTVITSSSFSQQAGLSERSRLAVLIVPFYPNPHMKLIYTLPSSEQGYYVCRVQPKSEPCRSFARGISCTFRILRWFLRRLCDRRMVSIPCMILKGRYM